MSSQSVAKSLHEAVESFCTLLERRAARLNSSDHLETVQDEEADARAAKAIGERLAQLATAVPIETIAAGKLQSFRHSVDAFASAPIRQHLPFEYHPHRGQQMGLRIAVCRAGAADLLRLFPQHDPEPCAASQSVP